MHALAAFLVLVQLPFGKPTEEGYIGVHDGPVLGSGISKHFKLGEAQHEVVGTPLCKRGTSACLTSW